MFECDWLKTNTKDCIHKALASITKRLPRHASANNCKRTTIYLTDNTQETYSNY